MRDFNTAEMYYVLSDFRYRKPNLMLGESRPSIGGYRRLVRQGERDVSRHSRRGHPPFFHFDVDLECIEDANFIEARKQLEYQYGESL